MFIKTMSQNHRNRFEANRFQHSKEIFHKQFKNILMVVKTITKLVINSSRIDETSLHILHNTKYYPYFEVHSQSLAHKYNTSVICLSLYHACEAFFLGLYIQVNQHA